MEHSFTLTITGADGGEWQGQIQQTSGSRQDFQSLMELVKIIKQDLVEKS